MLALPPVLVISERREPVFWIVDWARNHVKCHAPRARRLLCTQVVDQRRVAVRLPQAIPEERAYFAALCIARVSFLGFFDQGTNVAGIHCVMTGVGALHPIG